ncbi:hypothetical protein ElyMa_001351100 [Elysia marginata]|uniref:Uncharacterized protein n=1 Tax=Elysia marginata TaxID=1093978 RepID=A0AAV4IN37_9GAST|nr:hypothetical protein ElyMa_001351100 [Elysia marginata]
MERMVTSTMTWYLEKNNISIEEQAGFRRGSMAKSSSALKNSVVVNSLLKSWNATNLRYEESPHPTVLLRIPGLTHESFDRNWNPKATSLMQTSATARAYVFHTALPATTAGAKEGHETEEKYFLDWLRLTEEFLVFVSSSELVISRALYENNVQKWPLDMRFVLGNVGNRTITSTNEFYTCDGDCNKLLWTNTTQFVAVDKTTRKAAKLPDWYLSKYKGKGYMDKGLIVKPFSRPDVTYVHPHVVQWKDTDNYKHTNWTSYVRWATDALHAALLLQSPSLPSHYSPYTTTGDSVTSTAKAALHGITEDIIARGLQKMHIVYLRECLQGESVEIHVWQNSREEKELVYFSVVKDGEDVCQIKFWFFT